MGGPLQAADDMIRIIANGVTFGGADKIAAALGEQNTTAKTAAARDRAGIAGDLADVLGIGGGAKLAWKGATKVPAIARAVLSKKGAALAAVGLGGLYEHGQRTGAGDGSARAAPAKAAPPVRSQLDPDSIHSLLASAHFGQPASPEDKTPQLDVDNMVKRVAAAQGGISLRQLGAISEVARNTAPRGGRTGPKPSDVLQERLMNSYDAQREQEIKSGVDPAQAAANWVARHEGLAKLSATDGIIRQGNSEPYDDR